MEDLFKPKFVNLPCKPEEVKPISPEAVRGYFDASPVHILYGGIQSNIREKEETIVYEAAVNMGVDVDKEKLLHALAYDRMQYYEGFRAGERAAQPKWISVEEPPNHTCDYLVYVWVAYPDGITHMQMRTGVYNIVRKEWKIPHDQSEVVGEPECWMPLPEPPKEE